MEKHSVPGLSKGTALPSGFASASGCSVNWASGCANHAPLWPMLIPRHRKPHKKTPRLDAGRERRSLGDRRSALSATWLAAAACGSPQKSRDPVLLHAPTARVVGYFGAVRLRDGRFVFRLETGKFNGPSFLQFPQQLRSASRGTGRRVVVITDNARYHHSRLHRPWREQTRPSLCLGLPARLQSRTQPIERVWKLTRRRCCTIATSTISKTSSARFESEFATWTTRNDVLRRLCAIT